MSNFRFYIYKAIRKVLFLPSFKAKVLFIMTNWLPAHFIKTVYSERGNVTVNQSTQIVFFIS